MAKSVLPMFSSRSFKESLHSFCPHSHPVASALAFHSAWHSWMASVSGLSSHYHLPSKDPEYPPNHCPLPSPFILRHSLYITMLLSWPLSHPKIFCLFVCLIICICLSSPISVILSDFIISDSLVLGIVLGT